MQVEVSELIGPALDWAVAKADGNLYPVGDVQRREAKLFVIVAGDYERSDLWYLYSPSTDWSQGGPILENMFQNYDFGFEDGEFFVGNPGKYFYGWTALEAALRCYVDSKLGSKIEVPDELVGV